MSFVHLHLHTHYSLLEATPTPEAVAKLAAELQMPAVAITDNGNMYGAIEFYYAVKDKGVKPIIGLEVLLAPKSRHEKVQDKELRIPNRRLVLLAQDYVGYQTLCKVSSIGFLEGFYYKPRVDYEVLKDYNQNVIALTGGNIGEVPWLYRTQGPEVALEKIKELKEIYPERLYLELLRTGLPEWENINNFLLEASQITGVPVVAGNDVHYLKREDQIGQEVLICIGTNKTLQDESRFRLGSDQFYFKSAEEMKKTFKDQPQAVENTLQIAERCNVQFKLKDEKGKTIYHLPTPPTKEGLTLTEEIRRKSLEGLKNHLAKIKTTPEQEEKYYQRLEYELSVIDKMGFNGYYLIVADFIAWAKQNGVSVGPGRGSGAGSIVAFCLRITSLDPIPYNLIFERFLNPERVSMPDFDIDFCQEKRGWVIDYVTQKYGAESVSQIITYGKLMAKIAVRDVGRVLGKTYSEVDAIAKLIPNELNINLDDAIEKEAKLKQLMEDDPEVETLMNLARKVEGLNRHAGIHAAGVVIGDDKLVKYAPLSRGAQGEVLVQYDMKRAEKIGLIKFDFLGLKTLDHIDETVRLVKQNRGVDIVVDDIPIEDPAIYQIMCQGDTAGIFQFEGDGITDTVVKIQPSCFADITAINALYRPGPMNMIPEYTDRKHGRSEVVYILPELEEVLKETYGIVVYQEQVQQIAARIANYSLGEADLLRRAMGKKDAVEMERQRARFLEGAKKNNFDEKKALELFELMYKFAEYGFNKSHAAAYCVIAAQTAFLKFHYQVEFYAALMTTELGDTDKVAKYAKDARNHGIEVHPPHVNYSDFKFSVKGRTIYFGLGGIKGIGHAAINSILEARSTRGEKGFTSIDDFFKDLDLRKVNKKAIECLIKAGALEGLGYDRATLMAGYSRYVDQAESARKQQEIGQFSLFAMAEGEHPQVELLLQTPWPRQMRLACEKEVLGFYLSDHPLKGFGAVVKKWATDYIDPLMNRALEYSRGQSPQGGNLLNRWKKRTILLGIISEMREIITKKGTRMAFARLEDLTGSIELIIQADIFLNNEMLLKQERPVLLGGTLEIKEETVRLIVDTVSLLDDLIKKTNLINFHLSPQDESKIPRLKEILLQNPGTAKLRSEVILEEMGARVQMTFEKGLSISPELIESVYEVFSRDDFISFGTEHLDH